MNRCWAVLVTWLGPVPLLLGLLLALSVPKPTALARRAATGISIERATNDWRQIAAEPRPVGSPAHARTRESILQALRPLPVSVQEATAAVTLAGYTNAANVKNVLARIAGKDPKLPAVLLAAHYDTVPGSPGAVDDGVAVAALIETARVLTEGPPLLRDVLVLFTDAEELGLLGATAFMDEHPLAERVGLVANFEARGNSGELLLFQTSKGDRALLSQFGKATRAPNANSLFSTLARYLPNDTDATAFARRIPLVLGFAVAEGLEHYHGPTDDLAHADPSVLTDMAATAVELSRHFGNLGRLPESAGDALYFSLFGRWLISYPSRLATFTAMGLFVVWIGLVRRGLRNHRYTWRNLRAGIAWTGWTLLVSLALAITSQVLAAGRFPLRDWAAVSPAMGGAVVLVALGIQLILLKRATVQHPVGAIGLGALAVHLAIVLVLGWLAPAASALWHYPVGLALLGWSGSFTHGRNLSSPTRLAMSAVVSFAVTLFAAPTLITAFRVGGPGFICLPMVMSSLLLTLVLPAWAAIGSRWMQRLSLCMIVVGVVLLGGLLFKAKRLPAAPYLPTSQLVSRGGVRLNPRDTSLQQSDAVSVRRLTAVASGHRFEVVLNPSTRSRCVHLHELHGARVRAVAVNGHSVRPVVRFSPELDELGLRLMAGDATPRGFRFSACALKETLLELAVAGDEPVELAWAEELQ